jgi:hydroxymethylpyrimidine kinase/phosphomethylpyrimidine kinase
LYYDGRSFRSFEAPRIRTKNTHGTGCTFSAAIAAYLARGEKTEAAVGLAKKYITGAIAKAFPVGAGHGPVNHFFKSWKS